MKIELEWKEGRKGYWTLFCGSAYCGNLIEHNTDKLRGKADGWSIQKKNSSEFHQEPVEKVRVKIENAAIGFFKDCFDGAEVVVKNSF